MKTPLTVIMTSAELPEQPGFRRDPPQPVRRPHPHHVPADAPAH
ncbi:MAG: hypothetical protein ACLUS6_12490 [Dysosmobacter sp.]